MKKPRLKLKDTISLQSLSSGMAGEKAFNYRYLLGKSRLEEMFHVTEGANALKGIKILEIHPELRASDLMEAVQNPLVKGIFANIGGFDSDLIYKYLDLTKISANPKFLIGFSDITSVHLMFYKANVQSYYGPAVLDGFAENKAMHEITKRSFLDVINNNKQTITYAKEWTSQMLDWKIFENNLTSRKMITERYGHIFSNAKGQVSGHLLGGCLDTLVKITDEGFFPSIEAWKNSIIFLETSESFMSPRHFKNALQKLEKEINVCSGLVFGKPKDEKYFNEYLKIIKKIIKKPFVFNLNFGHTAPVYTLPYGGIMQIDFDSKIITVE